MDPILFRGIERLMIVGTCALTISFGYFLFARAISQIGEMKASSGTLSVSLSRIGPGVFFALFGMIVLVYCVTTPFTQTISGASGTIEKVSYATGGLPPKLWKEKAISGMLATNKALKYLQAPPKDSVEENDKRLAIEGLTTLRRTLVDQTFGDGAFEKYMIGVNSNSTDKSLTDDDRRVAKEIKSWLEEN